MYGLFLILVILDFQCFNVKTIILALQHVQEQLYIFLSVKSIQTMNTDHCRSIITLLPVSNNRKFEVWRSYTGVSGIHQRAVYLSLDTMPSSTPLFPSLSDYSLPSQPHKPLKQWHLGTTTITNTTDNFHTIAQFRYTKKKRVNHAICSKLFIVVSLKFYPCVDTCIINGKDNLNYT